MAKSVRPIPEGFRSITPNLVCRDAKAAIEFYKKVFAATVKLNEQAPDGKIVHAELQIGDSLIFVNEPMGEAANAPTHTAPNSATSYLHLYVTNADQVFERAVAEGSKVDTPIQDMFWGDRYGKVTDPFGQHWSIATHIEDVAPDEIKRRMQKMFGKAAGQN